MNADYIALAIIAMLTLGGALYLLGQAKIIHAQRSKPKKKN